jgi:hypothetical protein
VENFAQFPFCSKVEATYGVEIVSNVITVIASPPYVVDSLPYVDLVRLECNGHRPLVVSESATNATRATRE